MYKGVRKSGIGKNGGPGGGIVWLTSTHTVDITDSTIGADGHWGRVENYDQYGSGGGSGGSIQLTCQNLRGNGKISIRGGYGSPNGGGGGSGGRFVMNYLRAYRADSQPNQSYYWKGEIDYSGGTSGHMTDRYEPGAIGQKWNSFLI